MTAPVSARPVATPNPSASSSRAGAAASAPRPSTPAAPPGPPAPEASEVRQQAASDVHALQTARATAPSADVTYRRTIQDAVRIYLDDGPAALRVHLGDNPGVLSTLANVAVPSLERDLESALEQQASALRYPITGLDAATIQGIVESVAGARIRQGIVQEAETRVAACLADLEEQRRSLPARLEALRNATPGSPEALQAELLGIRGDASDLERAEARIAHSAQGLRTFVERMRGQSWQPGEFPRAAGRAARRLNLEGAANSSGITAGARTEQPGADVHRVLQIAETLHLVHSAAHLLRASGAALAGGAAGLAVGVIGLVVGLAVHHFTEQAHEPHVRFGRGLGL